MLPIVEYCSQVMSPIVEYCSQVMLSKHIDVLEKAQNKFSNCLPYLRQEETGQRHTACQSV